MSDEELEEFIETVEGNEEAVAQLVKMEAEIAEQAHSQLDGELQSEVAVSDLLPKVDDALDRIWDWWINRAEEPSRSDYE